MQKTKIISLSIWFLGLSALLTYLSGFHMIAFNHVELKIDSIKRFVAASEKSPQVDTKMALHHFLGTGCGCSKKILAYLEKRKKSNLDEYVHLIENKDNWKEKLESAGYIVEVLTEESAHKNYNIESVPLFSVAQSDRLLYQGGYNEQQMHNTNYEDLMIAQNLQQKKAIKEYPLFGCANGKIAKQLQDPLGVKYEE
jgi:hypothetical protein